MLVQHFIDRKAKQLAFYMRSYWQDELPYAELECFLWDTFEEWSQVKNPQSQAYSHKERIFWHVLHQTHYWEEPLIRNDDCIKTQLLMCILCLEGQGLCPLDVVGIRP
ncbi:MAG: hypothetical protein ACJAYN_000400 [Bermanella sp.]|uniref:hypothetical protein n=1 Tax=Glaciecola sp. 33A TaxID=2057807 RepID=UPI000C33317C|nr:hypothetical protein [Glaciecola sp. 33A]PKI00663.1 hypothetical protein CXF81_15535 [Glaciecola sp. 33A]